MKAILSLIILALFLSGVQAQNLRVSANRRFFAQNDGKPFFWLGDTSWLLFVKCSREETLSYLETRKAEGFQRRVIDASS